MPTMKELDAKLKEFWALLIGYGFLALAVWGCLYGCVWAFHQLRDQWNAPVVGATARMSPQPQETAPAKCTEDHRFERTEIYPIGLRADIALDSCSGKLCKTWSWVSTNKNSVSANYEDLPVCSELPDTRP